MDDLSGLSWTQASRTKKQQPVNSGSMLAELRSTPPTSGRSTPLTAKLPVNSMPPSKPSTPANDSFANLVNFTSTTSDKNLSLAERQRQLMEQKAREEQRRKDRLDAQYGGNNGQFWDNLEKSGSQPTARQPQLVTPSTGRSSQSDLLHQDTVDDDSDLLAAFNASAPVDKSTNFPVPSSTSPLAAQSNSQPNAPTPAAIDDDDDPFGLAEFSAKRAQKAKQSPEPEKEQDDDDVLGLLSKPVSDFPRPEPKRTTPVVREQSPSTSSNAPEDRAIAELVDMGFPIESSRAALATTESGTDIQQAVGWLLNQAHAESRLKAESRGRGRDPGQHQAASLNGSTDGQSERSRNHGVPSRLRTEDARFSTQDRPSSQNSANSERDPTQLATELGSNLFKSANSLWKSGTKKVQQAVQDFNTVPDSSQPRWMREAAAPEVSNGREQRVNSRQQPKGNKETPPMPESVTDEAMMLEPGRARPKPSRRQREESEAPRRPTSQNNTPERTRNQGFLQQEIPRNQSHSPAQSDSRPRLSRFNTEEQAATAYVSPARRKKATANMPPRGSDSDLLTTSASSAHQTRPATTSPPNQSRTQRPSPSSKPRKVVPPRTIPQISPSTLKSVHEHRQKGSDAYRRGDYAAAHVSYSSALSPTPETHPIAIVLLTNRALTALKTGEPKTAINDADRAISVIGPSKGESEKIELANGETKDMREFYGKALMRKAEALEQLERWAEAAKVWRDAVESGHGGSTSIQGRNRCDKAETLRKGGPSPASTVSSSSSSASKPRGPSRTPKQQLNRTPAPVSTKPAEAVNRLRAANEAADRVDNERFDLADSVDARLTAWRGSKKDNLRALLGSLDTVLWPEAGWKKVSMAELVLPNKVKIHYMKGIAKVHPDKISVNATTEQKMIAGAVFSTLNEAWDKFKRENGM